MKSNNPNQAQPNQIVPAADAPLVVQEIKNIELGKWLDQELQTLVERHAGFVTKKSNCNYFNRE